ncbi:MAG TPA: hemerythrin domain-containing protein [Stellaceae bacterium]|nr:hemerythrin domain-containing protein [Stellaceae bacterium]
MHEQSPDSRRRFLLASSGIAAAGLMLSGCATVGEHRGEDKEKEVTANEDLMREHGVLRRALLVYRLSAARLRINEKSVAPDGLNKTAMLFGTFGEDYHERQLEEPFIFPAVKQAHPALSGLVDTLMVQHQRGREITDYIIDVTRGSSIGAGKVEPLVRAMDTMVLMYEEHTAREDTVLFPAWKDALSGRQYDELNDKFEEIEHRTFGKDGFEDAVKKIADIEARLGIADLAQFTAPRAPSVKARSSEKTR